jgi:cytoskeletal protein RodZ
LLLLTTAFPNVLVSRRSDDEALVRHERALAALRDLAERPRPVAADLRSEPLPPTDHVRILHDPPASLVSHRRRTRRTGASAARPTTRRRPAASTAPAAVARPRIVVPATTFDDTKPEPQDAPASALTPEPVVLTAPPPTTRSRRRGSALAAAAAACTLVAGASAFALTAGRGTKKNTHAAQPVAATTIPAPRRVASTTVPAPPAQTVRFAASPTGDGIVTVRVPFTLTLAPTGPCWVRVQSESGQTLFEGTLQAGQHQQVTGSSPLIIRFGNTPAMQLLVNGAQLNLVGAARTANVRFVPPA